MSFPAPPWKLSNPAPSETTSSPSVPVSVSSPSVQMMVAAWPAQVRDGSAAAGVRSPPSITSTATPIAPAPYDCPSISVLLQQVGHDRPVSPGQCVQGGKCTRPTTPGPAGPATAPSCDPNNDVRVGRRATDPDIGFRRGRTDR